MKEKKKKAGAGSANTQQQLLLRLRELTLPLLLRRRHLKPELVDDVTNLLVPLHERSLLDQRLLLLHTRRNLRLKRALPLATRRTVRPTLHLDGVIRLAAHPLNRRRALVARLRQRLLLPILGRAELLLEARDLAAARLIALLVLRAQLARLPLTLRAELLLKVDRHLLKPL